MSVTEAVIEKLICLPPEKQEQVLNYVEAISRGGELPAKTGRPYEFLDIALKANLKGPLDWSEHLDNYLLGDKKNGF
jgi:hypothetical protein